MYIKVKAMNFMSQGSDFSLSGLTGPITTKLSLSFSVHKSLSELLSYQTEFKAFLIKVTVL